MPILRIDMAGALPTASEEPLGRYAGLGGRGLASTIVAEEVGASCHSLDPENRSVLAPGVPCGIEGSPADRMSVGCKSPLTGGVAVPSAGGCAGPALARIGYAAVVARGQSRGDNGLTVKPPD